MVRKTSNGVCYYDANGKIVSFPENHEFLFGLVLSLQAHKADADAVLKMKECVDE
jgi:hypothetical protein